MKYFGIASCFSMTVKYNDNNSHSPPVPHSNGTVPLNNSTTVKKMGAILCKISAISKSFFGVTNHPLHPFLAPKSTVLQH